MPGFQNNKKSIVVIGAWPPPSGGIASYTQDLYYNLLNKGIQIKVYAKGNFQSNDQNIQKIILTPKKPFQTFLSLIKIFKETPCKAIVHTQSFLTAKPSIWLYLFFYYFKFKKRIYLIETLHDGSLPERYNKFTKYQKLLYFKINKILDKLIVSNDILKQFCIHIGISNNKIFIINPFLPLDYLKNKSKDVPSEYIKFINKFSIIISTVGALIPDYDLQTIIDAFILFSEKYPNSGLVLLLTSFIEDKEYKKRVLEIINKRPNILVLENLPRNNVLDILSRTTIFIRGCYNDSFGLSKIEAILRGANVITVNSGITYLMKIYKYQNKNSLLENMLEVVLDIERNKNNNNKDTQIFYQKIANKDLKTIFEVYGI